MQKVSSDNGVLVSDSGTDSVQVLPGTNGMPVDDVSVLTIDRMSTNAVATTTIVQGVSSDSANVPGAESLGAKSDRSSDMGMDRTDEIAFRSLMVGDVTCLKGEVRALRTELTSLKSEMQVTPLFRDAHSADSAGNLQGNTCSLYVRLRGTSETCVGWVQLEQYLHCAVLRYACVRPSPDPAFRVVIYRCDLETALLVVIHQVVLLLYGGLLECHLLHLGERMPSIMANLALLMCRLM